MIVRTACDLQHYNETKKSPRLRCGPPLLHEQSRQLFAGCSCELPRVRGKVGLECAEECTSPSPSPWRCSYFLQRTAGCCYSKETQAEVSSIA